VLAPAQLPAPILDRLDQALSKALADPDIRAKLAEQGMNVGDGPATPVAFATYVQDEWAKYGKITRDLGLNKKQEQ